MLQRPRENMLELSPFSIENESKKLMQNCQGVACQKPQKSRENIGSFLILHRKVKHFYIMQNCYGGSLQNAADIRRKHSNLPKFLIETWSIFNAKWLGGSLVKRRRNQEKTLEVSWFFIEKFKHFRENILEVSQHWSIFNAKLLGGSLAKRCRNQEKTFEVSFFVIENWSIFDVQLIEGGLPNAAETRGKHWKLLYFSLKSEASLMPIARR